MTNNSEENEYMSEMNELESKVDIDVNEVMDSISLKPSEETTTKKPGRKKVSDKASEDIETDLFSEFSSFLSTKADINHSTKDKLVIPTGIDLVDAVLGGGFVVGSLGIIVGQPGSGKSMLAMQTLAQAQKQYIGKLLAGFLDSEEATTTVRLANLGVRNPSLKPYNEMTVEKVFKFIEGLCAFKMTKKIDIPSVVIWDSIANTLSQKELETDDPNSVIGYKARLLSILVPKYVAKCSKNDILLLAVNQLRDVIDMGRFSAPKDLKFMSHTKDMPGGTILKYNANQLVEMKVKSAIADKEAEKYGFEGIIAKLKCVKNKLFPPNVEVEVVGSFVTGFSNFWTNYNFLSNTNRLNTGSWNYLVSLPDKKFRTKDAPELYKNDEVFARAYDEAVKEAIQTEIIDSYNPVVE